MSIRSDISKVISVCCQYFQNSGMEYWIAVKRVMRYFKGTVKFGLVYRKDEFELAIRNAFLLKFTGFTDSDWAGDFEQRRFTAAYAVMVSSAVFFWSSKLFYTVCLFFTEAEYVVCIEAVKKLVFYRKFIEGLGVKAEYLTELLCDSQFVIALFQNSVYYVRIKYVEIKYYYIR